LGVRPTSTPGPRRDQLVSWTCHESKVCTYRLSTHKPRRFKLRT
jgi:hypothetical protein